VHVLLEKPITNTLEEAACLVELAASNQLVLQVGHLERFNPAIITLGQLLERPLFVESTRIAPFSQRSIDVSVVLDLMIHDIDLIHAVVGSPVKSIDANGLPVISTDIDIANARIKFENGCVANVTASRASFKTERKLRVFQHNAYFSLDLHQKKSVVYRKTGESPTFSQADISVEEHTFGTSDALMTQSEAFLDSVSGGAPPLVSGRVGMQALETALSITKLMQRS
jgi:predicted dehydrogenase